MQVVRSLEAAVEVRGGSAVAIGFFDGVHRGHQQLLMTAREHAQALAAPSVVITFEDHPQCLFTPGHCPAWLTTVDEKIAALAALDLDLAFVVPFDWSVARRPAAEFVEELLCARLGMRTLVCGADFALGQGRQGTVPFLRELGARRGFEVQVVTAAEQEGEVVSSTQIRDLLLAGEVATAAVRLGRWYRLEGAVIRGQGLGRQLGVPTLNLAAPARKVLPALGVYAAWAEWGGERRAAVVNLGHRPTVGGGDLSLECHVLETTLATPPSAVALHFVDRLRAEQKFVSLEALVAQIRRDVDQARNLLIR